MPKPKNTTARVLVPLITALLGLGVVWAVWKSNRPSTPANSQPATAAAPQPGASAPVAVPTQTSVSSKDAAPSERPAVPESPAAAPAAASAGSPVGLRAQTFTGDPLAKFDETVGGEDPKGDQRLLLRFSPIGAGLASLDIADAFVTIKNEEHFRLQHAAEASEAVLAPFAALAVEVTAPGTSPQLVPLAGSASEPVWRRVANTPAGVFEAFIVDDAGAKILRLERRFSLAANSRDVHVGQTVENLGSHPLTIRWYQTGAIDPPGDSGTYGGDKRNVRFGYLLPASRDPSRAAVLTATHDQARGQILGQRVQSTAADGSTYVAYRDWTLWPNVKSKENQQELSWVAFTSRYFAVAVHPVFDPNGPGGRVLSWLGQVDRVVLDTGNPATDVVGLRLSSNAIELGASGSKTAAADLSHGLFAGPLDKKQIKSEPLLAVLRLDRLVVYNFGGPCGICTWDWMTGLLLWIMRTLHDVLFHDWALSIIFLVVIVRSCLHPLTRWTQIRMNRFGKQMQAVGPKQKMLQERYKDDPAKLQQETAKLWREEGISPLGMLGCLPAFFQTPVWMALSATLFFAAELRHQPAFYGLFQSVQNKDWMTWWFMGDLAEPDGFIHFGRTVATLPILGPITSINVLPIVLGIVFFIQQKYLTPPQTTPMTPEQETQAKMMKWMTVFMFPVMMYNAPAGLALYFTVNSTLGILESKWIRSHMDKHGLLDLDKMRAAREARRKAKGGQSQGGFLATLQSLAERQQEAKKEFGREKRPGQK